MADVRVVRPSTEARSPQGLTYWEGVSTETAGSVALCLHRLVIPPGGRASAHRHAGHESAIYVLDGEVRVWWGEALEHEVVVRTGDYVYIPADVPHVPVNLSDIGTATALVARTDPHAEESVVLLPELDRLPHLA